MALFRTVGPQAEPVSVSECKAQLRIAHAAEDELIAGLVRAAREEVEQQTGLALIEQDWRMTADDWPRRGHVVLLRHPVREILSVTVFGAEGEASLLDPQSYQLDSRSRPARLHFDDRPRPGAALNGIEIDFRCGFGEAGTDVPDILKRAITMLVAHWYEFRGSFGAADQPVAIPDGFARLIAAHGGRRLL